MCAITYLLPISGKSIPSIKLHLSKKRQCLRYVDSPYPNTCVLEAIARYQLKDSKEKRFSDKQVLAKMKEIEAVQIKQDNAYGAGINANNYDDELIPYSIEVPILGYNSANPHQID
ncbi:MAG: hypothetical protein EZS28_024843 [Streblomastix strix]|uniref:Uncharacterized protein n=1 Tax=Streblomastix strix TaxID=222440 RepID=A0A5J4VAV8_9EUKA|nr:MAG: hypothetical protein EZS28_024843 [Streblomastix strix]